MKSNRHEKILEIIKNHDVETQEELIIRLKENGYNVTQATGPEAHENNGCRGELQVYTSYLGNA